MTATDAVAPLVEQQRCSRDLLLIDGSAPFFAPVINGQRQNWSKAPLDALLNGDQVDPQRADQVCLELEHYCRRVRHLGFTAITFDDLAHLIPFNFYPQTLLTTVDSFQTLFRRVFSIAGSAGLKIFVTTDLMFWNQSIENQLYGAGVDRQLLQLFTLALQRFYRSFPEVSGIVIRIGEADGCDVSSAFKSRIWIRTPKQCNRWLKEILTICEQQDRLLIFRTWSLGAYPIGDISWNESTENKAFAGISSDNFVVSRKFGEADFFRYLPLNERILQSRHAQIIELQARREYEGFGKFPAYVGRQYQDYRDQLKGCPTLRGISVWCQTGGWSHFDRLTFLETSSPWNELNSVAALKLFTTEQSADEILYSFCVQRFGEDAQKMVELVQLFDRLVDRLWYFAPFARRSIWFRRLRFPPLLWIFWDTVLVNQALRLIFRTFLDSPAQLRKDDREERVLLRQIRRLIAEVGSEQQGLTLGVDTLRLLYSLRRFYLGQGKAKRIAKITARIARYQQQHPAGFLIESDFSPFRIRWVTAGVLFGVLTRNSARYRLLDQVLLISLTGWFFPILKRWQRHRIPDLAERQAEGLELFFR